MESVALGRIQDPSMSVDYPPDDLLEAFALYPAQESPASIKVDFPESKSFTHSSSRSAKKMIPGGILASPSFIPHSSQKNAGIGSPQRMDCDTKDSDVPTLDPEDKIIENGSEMQIVHSTEASIGTPQDPTPTLDIPTPTPHQVHSDRDSFCGNFPTQDPEQSRDDSRIRVPSSLPRTVDRAIQTELHSQTHIQRLIPLLPIIISPVSFLRAH